MARRVCVCVCVCGLQGGATALYPLIEELLEWQWGFLAQQTPDDFLQEIQGLADGSTKAGVSPDAGKVSIVWNVRSAVSCAYSAM